MNEMCVTDKTPRQIIEAMLATDPTACAVQVSGTGETIDSIERISPRQLEICLNENPFGIEDFYVATDEWSWETVRGCLEALDVYNEDLNPGTWVVLEKAVPGGSGLYHALIAWCLD